MQTTCSRESTRVAFERLISVLPYMIFDHEKNTTSATTVTASFKGSVTMLRTGMHFQNMQHILPKLQCKLKCFNVDFRRGKFLYI